jgi:hypothetical protein
VFGQKVQETRALLAGYGTDAAERAAILIDAVGLHMAAQTAAAVISRPELQPLACS